MPRQTITIHGPTAVTGGWNVIGIKDGVFILQGNLTTDEIKELRDECNAVLKSVKEGK